MTRVFLEAKTVCFALPSNGSKYGVRVLTDASEAAWFKRLEALPGFCGVDGPAVNGVYGITFAGDAARVPDEELVRRVQATLRGIKYER